MADNNEFNNEPVFYCKHCLSLKIKSVPGMEELDYWMNVVLQILVKLI